jgi:hypothetical protein
LYVPHVGQATWLSFGCWHCGQVERAAAVVFHMLRRERVFERDIFRFGTGTVIFLNLDGYLIAANLDLLLVLR